MVMINSKLLPPVCFSWICEIPRRHRNWSPNLWPIFVTGPRPVTGPPDCDQFPCQVKSHPLGHRHRLAQHALSQSSSSLPSLSRFTAYLSETHHFFPTVVSQLWGSSGCCERQKFHYRTPLLLPWYCVQIYFVKLLKLRNLEEKSSSIMKSLEFSSHLKIFCAFLTSLPSGT